MPASRSKRASSYSQYSRRSKRPVLTHLRQTPRSTASRSGTEPPLSVSRRIVEADQADEELDQIIMALDIKDKGTVGCAYYVVREERLHCMEDIAAGGLETIEKLKFDIRPTIILSSTRVEAAHEEQTSFGSLRDSSVSDTIDGQALPFETDVRPSAEFNLQGALNKLAKLIPFETVNTDFLVPGEATTHTEAQHPGRIGLTDEHGKLLTVSSRLNLDSHTGIGCIGAVLAYLQRKRTSEYLHDDPDMHLAYRVAHMEMFSLKNTMLINVDTLTSLQIMQPETHPNAYNQGSSKTGSKESLSVYGLFQHLARTTQGKTRLRQCFLRPSLDIGKIKSQHDFISIFTRPENQLVCARLSKSLGKIKDMRKTMMHLHKGVSGTNQRSGCFKSGVWASLLEFCFHTIDVADALREVVGGSKMLVVVEAGEVLDRFQLQRIGKMIHDAVDIEVSIEQQRTVIKHGIDEKLDKIKSAYDGMDDVLSKVAMEISQTLPSDVETNLNVIYFPQLGFHIIVHLNEATREPAYNGADLGWQRAFTTQSQAYFKDARMREMDVKLGDLWAGICDIEIELAYDLAQKVLEDEKLLVSASDICGELDCLLGLAQGAVQYKLVRPNIVEENLIDIRGGRHILQELVVPSYVPNNTTLQGGDASDIVGEGSDGEQAQEFSPSMIILTGPNYSGKSIYLKQVALIVYLAQIGSFVPAEAASIGITDKILTRISTRESVSRVQSAFMIDMQQVAMALNSFTARTLLIIDEFGKGTDSCDGAGLAAGVLNYFLSRGPECPKVLAATHFHEIFECGDLFQNRANLGLFHMEVRVDERQHQGTLGAGSEVTYLYNLRPGRSTLSYGTQCATMNGIPESVVTRAVDLAALSLRGEDLVGICSALSEREEQDLEEAEEVARAFLKVDFEDMDRDQGVREVLDGMLLVGSTDRSSRAVSATN